ncbi:MAG TPA: hypothetical protein ENI72_01705 [Rhodospirillales bacterium]|nr:hypothetical protein [Rhodospirillales bacterium]
MRLKKLAEQTSRDVAEVMAAPPTDAEAKKIVALIEHAIVKAVLETGRRHLDVAVACCSPDRDMAHKISEKLNQANAVLIANLSSLR